MEQTQVSIAYSVHLQLARLEKKDFVIPVQSNISVFKFINVMHFYFILILIIILFIFNRKQYLNNSIPKNEFNMTDIIIISMYCNLEWGI